MFKCPYCDEYLGEFDNAAFHDCPNEPPTNWASVARGIGWIVFVILLGIYLIQ